MSRGYRRQRAENTVGRDYFKRRGFLNRCWGWMQSVSLRSGVNKVTKRLTNNKSERQQVRS